MVDFEVDKTWASPLAKAVFSGPGVPPAVIKKMVAANGLTWPVQIMAVRTDRTLKLGKHTRQLKLHDGQIYLISNASSRTLNKLLRPGEDIFGQAQQAPSPDCFLSAIQLAIISMREVELKHITSSPTPSAPSAQSKLHANLDRDAEVQTASLLLQQINQRHPAWQETAELWLCIVLHRHRKSLNEVHRKLIQCLTAITRSSDHNPPLSYALVQGVSSILRTCAFSDLPDVVMEVLKAIVLQLPVSSDAPGSKSEPVVQAVNYLRANFQHPISLRDAAAHVHVSDSHLARCFRREMNQTLTHYLQQLRIAGAMEQLAQTDQSILNIGLSNGFDSVEHFHRMFKRHTGLTPGQYRLNNKN